MSDTRGARVAPKSNERSGSALAKGTALNLLGQGLPLIVAVLCLPVVVAGMGPERFGVLALSWTVVGYLGVLDLGLGRGAARFIAAALARGAAHEVPRILGTALCTRRAVSTS